MKITLWHGGRDLEYSYREFKPSNKGRWEYGPGLYLSTSYERARKYSKGNGSTYKVSVECENNINTIFLDVNLVNEFINRYCVKSKQKELMIDVYDNINRTTQNNKIRADYFLNLIINSDSIKSKNTKELNDFLVSNSVDYAIETRYGGGDESILIIFNNKSIKSVKKIMAKDVLLEEYNLLIDLNNTKLKI